MDATVLLEDWIRPGVVRLTLNRPDHRNALNQHLLERLLNALHRIREDENTRVVVLRGAGPAFCSGMDLREAMEAEDATPLALALATVLHTLSQLPQVTIAAVHGAAVAGGAGLMSACDLAVAAAGTRIGYPEVRRGLVAGLVMTFLRRQIPERHARELLLLGEIIDAERAAEIALISRWVPADLLDDVVEIMVSHALKGSPAAIQQTKHWLDTLWRQPLEKDLEQALELHVHARRSEAAQEGMRAFLEKRAPRWTLE